MALNKRTADDLMRYSELIREAADTLQFISENMKQMPHLWLNSHNAENKLIPEIRKFARKAKSDFETELEAFAAGKVSPAELNKTRSELNKRYKKSEEIEVPIAEPELPEPPKKAGKKKGK